MKTFARSLVLAVAAMASSQAAAGTPGTPPVCGAPGWSVAVIEIRPAVPLEIDDPSAGDLMLPGIGRARGRVDRPGAECASAGMPAGLDLDVIIRIGKALWEIVKENRPTAEMTSASASAIPQGISSWDQLEGWNPRPAVRTYRVRVRNAIGTEVASYTYSIVGVYGGSLGGKGKYLQDVRVIANEIRVAWGYHVNAGVVIPAVFNTGHAGSPVAAMDLVHRFTVTSAVSHYECTQHFVIQGDGQVELTGTTPGPRR